VKPEIGTFSSDVAFTPSVKRVQSLKGSREAYARLEARGGWQTHLSGDIVEFIAAQRSFFMATASREGQPYMQHRGGPPGFLRVLDARTLAFADYAGKRQYITLGNLDENPRAQLFLIDYVDQRRVKVWGEARVVEDDPELLARLKPPNYRARAERAIVFSVHAWDENCPQHIPRRYEADDVDAALMERDRRIAQLEAELRAARGLTGAASGSPPANAAP
jgi:predicted pyridoxine 5'-phosphate oxidase superfamily flavin-nucleotide-binding protein